MSAPNGHAEASRENQVDRQELVSTAELIPSTAPGQLAPKEIKRFVDLLEIPFDASVIEWRVTNTSKRNGNLRGQVIPYADQRAYTDRLNALFTPAGWTRKYTVHTTSNFQRDEDQKLVAKVFVTCEVTIFGVGSHSATGEEWTDDENAITSAEAQAFKRACSCFGLGRYLYYFSGIWVDLDDKRRPTIKPVLTGWATAEGWIHGLRPESVKNENTRNSERQTRATNESKSHQNDNKNSAGRANLIGAIEAMAEPLGRGLYRGLLKSLACVWSPSEVHDTATLHRVLTHMQAADRGLRRLESALELTGREPLDVILRSLNLKSVDRVDSLEALHKIVTALEEQTQRQS